jgi:hypothetical protein
MLPKNPQTMPQLKQVIGNSSNTASLEVYQFNGYNSPAQAIQAIQQYLEQYGASIQYNSGGQISSGCTTYSGQTYINGIMINWVAAFKPTGSGVAGIAVGALSTTGNKYQSIAAKILNSLR